ncbi:hypothetical protein [Staphylococcus pasteuri]|uniref:hypothetical protein n=1 Tax=Staphylococcus pasteuri TaxID=45972 RepID=UPI0012B93462|nr:hypothetical protein [Staphylococcus pasteuri]
MKKVAGALLTASLLLAGCSFGNNDNDKGSSKVSDDSTSESNSNSDNKSNNNQSSQSSSSSNNSSSNHSKSQQEDTNSEEYYAKVWLTALDSYRGSKESQFEDLEIQHGDASNGLVNPYMPKNSARLPEGTQVLLPSVNAAGQVVYKNNNDGTITLYNVPSHFQGKEWVTPSYSDRETQRIIDEAKTVKLYGASQSEIDKMLKYMSSEEVKGFGEPIDENQDFSESDDSDDSDSSSDSEDTTVTRDNVIDKVEDYEGHKLDTDTYTYKEPEKNSDGEWGFSFTDKDGDLAGSYIVDEDGNVTKYDENGDEE